MNQSLISEKMAQELNKQARDEATAGNIYRSFALWCDRNGYPGCEKFFNAAAHEEFEHRDKILDYLNDFASPEQITVSGGKDREYKAFGGLVDLFEQTYQLEVSVSQLIHNCYSIAMNERDWHTVGFLHWFLDEQRDAVASSGDILAMCRAAGDNLLEFDEQIGAMA